MAKTVKMALFLLLLIGGLTFFNQTTISRKEGVTTYATKGSIQEAPSITVSFINNILCTFHSPTCQKGQALYDLGVHYGIDPAYALAFFLHESSFGTAGMATITLGLGNERCLDDRPCVNTQGGICQVGQSCYAKFSSWEDGFAHWYMLIKQVYIDQWKLTTIPAIIHRYAPSADNNDEKGYASAVEHAVAIWQSGKIALS